MKKIIPLILVIGSMVLSLLIFYLLFESIFRPSTAVEIVVLASFFIASGLASLDILRNIFAGIMIEIDHPFQVGDNIRLAEFNGRVIKIGLRSTKIIMHNDSGVIIPNSHLMNRVISNINNGQPDSQITAEIFLPIDIDTDKIRQIAIEAAQVSRYIYLNKPVTVLFFNEIINQKAYLKMIIKAYVMDTKYEFHFKSDLTEIVIKELLSRNLITAGDYTR